MLQLFIDVQNRVLRPSFTAFGVVDLPKFVQAETIPVQLFFVQPVTADPAIPYEILDYRSTASYTVKVGACKLTNGTASNPALLMFTDSFTDIGSPYAGLQGVLSFDNAQVATDIGALTSIDAYLEIEVTDPSGNVAKVYQEKFTLKAAVIDDGSVAPAPAASYYTKGESDAKYLTNTTALILTAPDLSQYQLTISNDGHLIPIPL